MAVRNQMTAILILAAVFCFGSACELDNLAVYKVKLKMLWSENTLPNNYDAKGHWSEVFGQSHNRSYALNGLGDENRPAIIDFLRGPSKDVAGRSAFFRPNLDRLMEEGEEEPKVLDQFTAPSVEEGQGETESVVLVDGGHSLVSLICRMIPSATWFIAVDSLDLCLHSSWIDEVTLDLEPLEAIDISEDQEQQTLFVRRLYNGENKFYRNQRPHTIAKVEFIKIKEYSTKKLNDLSRKGLLDKSQKTVNENHVSQELHIKDYWYNAEDNTKNSFERLKDLEEDPIGTPRPNVPENNVVVVTKSPIFKFKESEAEFESHVESMDDVVLAVANGRKLGLGKHLPRHFRSRLHHAVNKYQSRDCIVSEWSNWSHCSDPCDEKTRVRTVVRKRKGDGRECPSLVQKQTCGRCVRGDGF